MEKDVIISEDLVILNQTFPKGTLIPKGTFIYGSTIISEKLADELDIVIGSLDLYQYARNDIYHRYGSEDIYLQGGLIIPKNIALWGSMFANDLALRFIEDHPEYRKNSNRIFTEAKNGFLKYLIENIIRLFMDHAPEEYEIILPWDIKYAISNDKNYSRMFNINEDDKTLPVMITINNN